MPVLADVPLPDEAPSSGILPDVPLPDEQQTAVTSGIVPDVPLPDEHAAGGLVHALRYYGEQAAFGGPARFVRGVGQMTEAGAEGLGGLAERAGLPFPAEALRSAGRAAGSLAGQVAAPAEAQLQTQPANRGEQLVGGVASAVTGDVPMAAGAAALGGPVAGFAGLAALQAYARGASLAEIGAEAVKGALTGGAMGATEPLTRLPRAAAQAAIGAAQEPEHPLAGAATMATLGQLGGGPGTETAADVARRASPTLDSILRAREIAQRPEAPAPEPPLTVADLGAWGSGIIPDVPLPTEATPQTDRGLIPGLGEITGAPEVAAPPAAPQTQPAAPEQATGAVSQPSERSQLAARLNTGEILTLPGASFHHEVVAQQGYNPGDVLDTGFMVNGVYRPQEMTARETVPAAAPEVPRETIGSETYPSPRILPDEQVGRVPIDQIQTDETRFQTRARYGAGGVSGQLAATDVVHEPSLGNIAVWQDPADQQLYVVDGHNRLDLLKRSGATDARVVVLTDAQTAPEARVEGALMNMRQGSFTAIDVAQVLRDAQITPADLRARGIPMTAGQIKDGVALANLHPALFGMVARGEIPVSRGATIGREMGAGPEAEAQQLALADLAGRRPQLSDADVAELIRQTRAAPMQTETQTNLFGEAEVQKSLAVERAQAVQGIREQLSKDKRLFGFVAQGERAARLGQEGTTVDVGRAQSIAQQSAQVGELFDRLANRAGSVAEVVNDAARQIAQGQPVAEAVRSALPRVRDAITAELAPGAGPAGASGAAGAEGEGAPGAEPGLFGGSSAGAGPERGAAPGPAGRLTNEQGALTLPNPRLITRGREFIRRQFAEQAAATEQQVAKDLEASRQRIGSRLGARGFSEPGTARPPLPGEGGALQAPGGGRDVNRLAPTVGEVFGPEVTDLMNDMGLANAHEVEYARRAVVPDRLVKASGEQIAQDFANRIGEDPEVMGEFRARSEALNAERMWAGMALSEKYMRDMLEEMNRAGPTDAAAQLEAYRKGLIGLDLLRTLPGARQARTAATALDAMIQDAGAAAEAGRALRIRGIFARQAAATPEGEALTRAARLFHAADPETARARLQAVWEKVRAMQPNDLAGLSRLVGDLADKPRPSDYVFEAMMGAYLSAPKGRVAHLIGNTLMALRRPAGTAIAVPAEILSSRVEGRPPELFAGQVVADAVGMLSGFPEAGRRFLRTMVTEQTTSGKGFLDYGGRQRVIPGKFGQLVRTGSRVTSALDEFFRHVNEQGALYSRAYQLAKQGGATADTDLAATMADIIKHPDKVHGLLAELAQEQDYRTFREQTPLVKMLQGVRRYGQMRFLMPFIRTAANLTTVGARDVALPVKTTANLVGTLLGDYAPNAIGQLPPPGAARSQQLAGAAVSALLVSSLLALAERGLFTGSGPGTEAERRELRGTGWKPNSLKIGDQYVDYNRSGHIATSLGLIADLADALHTSEHAINTEDAAAKLSVWMLHSLGQNFLNKPYMKGLSDAIEAMLNPEEYGPNFINQTVAGVVPVIVAETARARSPEIRVPKTLRETFESRIPGLNTNVFPLRNIWGEPILAAGGFVERMLSPFERQKIMGGAAIDEMKRLQYSPGSPMRDLDIDHLKTPLTSKEYDQYAVRSGGLAKDLLTRIVTSPGFQHIPSTEYGDRERREIIQRVFYRARMIARAELMPQVAPRSFAELRGEMGRPGTPMDRGEMGGAD